MVRWAKASEIARLVIAVFDDGHSAKFLGAPHSYRHPPLYAPWRLCGVLMIISPFPPSRAHFFHIYEFKEWEITLRPQNRKAENFPMLVVVFISYFCPLVPTTHLNILFGYCLHNNPVLVVVRVFARGEDNWSISMVARVTNTKRAGVIEVI